MTDRLDLPAHPPLVIPADRPDWPSIALDVVADVVSVVEDDVVRWISPSVEALTGWSPADVTGRSAAWFLHADDDAPGPDDLPAHPGEVRVSPRVRLRHRDGTHRWVEALLVRRGNPDGSAGPVVISTRDVSEQVRLEDAARAAQDRLRAALDASPDGFAVHRVRRGPDGTVTGFTLELINAAGAAVYGVPPEAMAGSDLDDLLEDAAAGEQVGALLRRAADGHGTHRLRTSVCTEIFEGVLDVSAVRVDGDHVLVTWRDVTDLVLAEGVLIDAYGRAQAAWDTLHATLDAMPDAVLLVDVLTGEDGTVATTVAHANLAAADRLGTDRDAAIGRPLGEVLGAGHPSAVTALVLDTAADRTRRTAHVAVEACAGRPALALDVTVTPVGGTHVAVTCRDVTRRENDLRRSEQSRRQAEHDTVHDRMTGLPNRDGLEQLLRRALMSCPPDGGVLVMLCDVRVEEVNAAHGLRVGDDVLCVVAGRLAAVVGEDGTAARLGAGAFVLVAPAAPGAPDAGAAVLHERVRAALAEPVTTARGRVAVPARLAHHVARPAGLPADREPVEVLDVVLRRIASSPPL